MYCLLTARKRYIGQMQMPFKVQKIGGHYLTAPYCTVCAVACAIGGDSDHRPLQSMLSYHTSNMRMVMLDANFPGDVRVERVFCRQILRVQVVGNRLRINIEEALEMLNALTERGERLQVLQVADMMADKG